MDYIIKLPSGFCALISQTNAILNAALIPWSGSEGGYTYDINKSGFEYYQAADKTVYYTDADGTNARIWCAGSELRRHLHRLEQIKARRTKK